MFISQGYGPHNAAVTVATTLMGARRYIADWREIAAWAEQARLKPLKVLKANGLFLGLYKGSPKA